MSVHGEFNRALERLIDCIGMLDGDEAAEIQKALEAARISAQPNLSSAAQAAQAVLEMLGKAHSVPDSEILSETRGHLQAHCSAILG